MPAILTPLTSYPLTPDPTSKVEAAVTTERDTASHENSSGGTLVLGHTSLLTSFLLSLDEKYILTADRDEHIRVSWYPQGYCIESYCLGHRKYVRIHSMFMTGLLTLLRLEISRQIRLCNPHITVFA